MKNKKKFLIIIVILFALMTIIQLDVRDAFSHGYYTEMARFEDIDAEDIEGYLDLSTDSYTVTFEPIKNHFVGFILYIADQIEDNTGSIKLEVKNDKNQVVDTIYADLGRVRDCYEYELYANKELKKGETYTVQISAVEYKKAPSLILVDPDYITDECNDNNILLGYAYKQSTFSHTEKIFLTILILSLVSIILSILLQDNKKVYLRNIGVFALLVVVMAWNFSYNSLDDQNTMFENFDKWSESLVTSTIQAEKDGMQECVLTGLNGYTNVTGNWNSYDRTFLTDDNWTQGYSNSEAMVLFRSSDYIDEMAKAGNSIIFANGETFLIKDTVSDGIWTTVNIDADRVLNYWKYGSLADVSFMDKEGNVLPKGNSFGYYSQYGLQGRIFKHLARYLEIDILNALCALAAAVSFAIIVYLINYKFNTLLASIFYIVFLLSPWIVGFANNLYWVEFTWFLPMGAGLLCAWKIDNKKYRIISYIIAFLAILIKCLCGYEYISNVMMGLIAFLLVDFIETLFKEDRAKKILLFKTIFTMGIVALLGFVMAICIHAPEKPGADGNILKGINLIIQNDVLRRTYGFDINNLGSLAEAQRYGILASLWEVLCQYFHFDTEIITGLDGNLFPLLCLIPIVIFIFDYRNKKLNIQNIVMYLVFFISSITWFILAKSHSYVHTQLNYVLWYFGFVQICLYIIVNKIIQYMKRGK